MNQKTWQNLTIVLLIALLFLLVFTLISFKKDARECVSDPEAYLINRMSKANNNSGIRCYCETDSFPRASKEWRTENYKYTYGLDFKQKVNVYTYDSDFKQKVNESE